MWGVRRDGTRIGGSSCYAHAGFTLTEVIVVIAVIGVISAFALPAVSSYFSACCVKAAIWEISGMYKEAKQRALIDDKYYAVGFDPLTGRVSLIADKGKDGTWNTADDTVVRSFNLQEKGGNVHFGYGSCGPIPGLANAADGISFPNNNTAICNPNLTGNAGTVYLTSTSGVAMALTVNSEDFGSTIYRWNGKKWVKM